MGITGEQVRRCCACCLFTLSFLIRLAHYSFLQFGEMSPSEALEKAKALKLDLTLVSTEPAVGKMTDPKVDLNPNKHTSSAKLDKIP